MAFICRQFRANSGSVIVAPSVALAKANEIEPFSAAQSNAP